MQYAPSTISRQLKFGKALRVSSLSLEVLLRRHLRRSWLCRAPFLWAWRLALVCKLPAIDARAGRQAKPDQKTTRTSSGLILLENIVASMKEDEKAEMRTRRRRKKEEEASEGGHNVRTCVCVCVRCCSFHNPGSIPGLRSRSKKPEASAALWSCSEHVLESLVVSPRVTRNEKRSIPKQCAVT